MADSNGEIKLRLLLDNQEAIISVQQFDDGLKIAKVDADKITGTISKFRDPITGNALAMQQFANELTKTDLTQTSLIEGIKEYVSTNKISETQLREVVSILKEEQSALAINSAEYMKHQQAISAVNSAYAQMAADKRISYRDPITGNALAMQQFARQLVETKESQELTIAGVKEFISVNKVNETQLREVISTLKQEQSQLTVGSQAYIKYQNAMNAVNTAHMQIVTGQTQVKLSSYGLNTAFMQLGFMLGDMQMIGTNWRMVLLGMGNNIPFVAQGLMGLSGEAVRLNTTIGALVRNSIMGPAGILIGINLLVTGLTVAANLFGKSSDAADKQVGKMEDLAEKYKEATKQLNRYNYANTDEAKKAIKEHARLYDERLEQLKKDEEEAQSSYNKLLSKFDTGGQQAETWTAQDKANLDAAASKIRRIKKEISDMTVEGGVAEIFAENRSKMVANIAENYMGSGNIEDFKKTIVTNRVNLDAIKKEIEKLRSESDWVIGGGMDVRAQQGMKAISDLEKKSSIDQKDKKDKKEFTVEEALPQEIEEYRQKFYDSQKLVTEEVYFFKLGKLREEYLNDIAWADKAGTSKLEIEKKYKDARFELDKQYKEDSWTLEKRRITEEAKERFGVTLPAELEKRDLNLKQPAGFNNEFDKTQKETNQVRTALMNAFGNPLANALQRSLGLLKQTNNVLLDIMGTLLSMALNGVIMGFVSMFFGGGFLSGLGKAFGLDLSSGGGITEMSADERNLFSVSSGSNSAAIAGRAAAALSGISLSLSSSSSGSSNALLGEIQALRSDLLSGRLTAAVSTKERGNLFNSGSAASRGRLG